MSTRARSSNDPPIPFKRYFDASPTWFAWNHLTAADVAALRTEPGFEGQHIYFHLNHPIHFVRLVGLLSYVEIKAGRYLLLTLDDGSGACIEVKTTLRERKAGDHAEYPSNTLVDNVDVHVELGLPALRINNEPVEIGTVIKAKGTIDTFRNTRQLKLERIWVVKDTNEEVKAWAETAKWKRDVLSRPWNLTQAERDDIDARIEKHAEKERERSQKKHAHNKQHEERKKRKLEKDERRRKREEEMYNAGALPGSGSIPTRITDS